MDAQLLELPLEWLCAHFALILNYSMFFMHSLSVGSCMYRQITGHLGKGMETDVEGIILDLI
jgi:hypothetical protein